MLSQSSTSTRAAIPPHLSGEHRTPALGTQQRWRMRDGSNLDQKCQVLCKHSAVREGLLLSVALLSKTHDALRSASMTEAGTSKTGEIYRHEGSLPSEHILNVEFASHTGSETELDRAVLLNPSGLL